MTTYIRIPLGIVFALCALFLLSSQAFAKIECDASRLTPVSFGSSGISVTRFQECLIGLGFDIPAGASGYFGGQTQIALINFYKHRANIKVNGLSFGPLGIATMKKLLPTSGSSVISSAVSSPRYVRVSSSDDLEKYLRQSNQLNANQGYFGGGIVTLGAPTIALRSESVSNDQVVLEKSAPGRVSETNVQVVGIDEPDVLKTDGSTLYFSRSGWYDPLVLKREGGGIIDNRQTLLINAFPPSKLGVSSGIEEQGDLLLVKDKKILIVSNYQGLTAYDVSSPNSPEKKWTSKIESEQSLITSRLANGKVYLVTQKWTGDSSTPCPIRPMTINGAMHSIPCHSIWRPADIVPVDAVYTVMKIDPSTGKVESSVSFVGTYNNSAVYMSDSALYATQYESRDYNSIFIDFMMTGGNDLLPSAVLNQIRKVIGYDLTEAGKGFEVQQLINQYAYSLSDDAQLKFRNDLNNAFTEYTNAHKNTLESTTVVKISIPDLAVVATGKIPGYVLNQYSLDEYNGHLRLSSTVGSRQARVNVSLSESSIYVLDSMLRIVGSVGNLGLTERIYSTRFVGDRVYLVTFRETDPFYVIDLSDPRHPKKAGELKIPGFSAYLHPISENIVLGVGRDGSKVKLSLFDVSDPARPLEVDTYALDEYHSEVLDNPRAFLLDEKHKIFFIPGNQGGYVFSYTDSSLTSTATLAKRVVRRAAFLDDYLYLISESGIVVYDEKKWERVNEITF